MQQQETSGENQAPVHSQFGVTLYDDRVTPPPPYPGQVESGQFAEPMTSLPPTDDLPPRYSQAVHDEYHTTTPLPLQPSQQQQQQQQQQQVVLSFVRCVQCFRLVNIGVVGGKGEMGKRLAITALNFWLAENCREIFLLSENVRPKSVHNLGQKKTSCLEKFSGRI